MKSAGKVRRRALKGEEAMGGAGCAHSEVRDLGGWEHYSASLFPEMGEQDVGSGPGWLPIGLWPGDL